jgi:mono/diheme cytochrome c family protein
MPIGLVVATLIFGVLTWIWREPFLTRLTRYCLVLAWLFFFPTVLLGFMDWQHWYQGALFQTILIKICLACFLFLLLSVGMILTFTGREGSKALLVIYLIAFFTVGGLGFFGGRLVFGGRAPAAPVGMEAGRRLFMNNCMACHPNMGNAIMPDMIIIGSDNLTDLATFIKWIRNPLKDNGQKGPMPQFLPWKISEAQAKQLYDYLIGIVGKPKEAGAHHHEH